MTTETAPLDVEGLERVPPFAPGGVGELMSRGGYAYLEDYVFSLEDGPDHEPTDFERAMLEDFMAGLLADEAMFGPVRRLLSELKAARDRLAKPFEPDEIEALQEKWPRVVATMLAAERATQAAEAELKAAREERDDALSTEVSDLADLMRELNLVQPASGGWYGHARRALAVMTRLCIRLAAHRTISGAAEAARDQALEELRAAREELEEERSRQDGMYPSAEANWRGMVDAARAERDRLKAERDGVVEVLSGVRDWDSLYEALPRELVMRIRAALSRTETQS